MDRQQLTARLQQLHGELKNVEGVNESERQMLEKLSADIQSLLDKNSGSDPQRYARLGERLKKGIEEFEAAHPTVSTLMSETIDLLAKMGI